MDPDVRAVRRRDDQGQHVAPPDRHCLRAHAAAAGRHGGGVCHQLRRLRGHLGLVDRHHAGHRQRDVPGHARRRLRQPVLAGRGDGRWHPGHHHPAVHSADPVRARDGDVDHRVVRRRRGARPADPGGVRAARHVGEPACSHPALRVGHPGQGAARGRVGGAHAGHPAGRHLQRLLLRHRGGCRGVAVRIGGGDRRPPRDEARRLLRRGAGRVQAGRHAVPLAGGGAEPEPGADRAPRAAADGRADARLDRYPVDVHAAGQCAAAGGGLPDDQRRGHPDPGHL